jgi:glycosyltransferase involved in cell wall biosynthesis
MLTGKTSENELVFFSFVGSNYSRSSTILNFKSDKHEKIFTLLPTGVRRFTKTLFKNRKKFCGAEALVVMSPCHVITPFLKLISRNRVILDAGWSLTDGQLSRSRNIRDFPKLVRCYLIDLIAFHSADIVIVESTAQAVRTSSLFFVPKKKICVNFTGLDEQVFQSNSTPSQRILQINQRLATMNFELTVLFRGKINNEAGVGSIVEAAQILEKEFAFILVCGRNDRIENLPQNTILLADVTTAEMKAIYEMSDVALGQLSSNPRLSYTIPHKAFEAGYFAKPYVTTDSVGIRELYNSKSAILLSDNSGENLAFELQKLRDVKVRSKYSANIRAAYFEKSSQELLNARFEKLVDSLR